MGDASTRRRSAPSRLRYSSSRTRRYKYWPAVGCSVVPSPSGEEELRARRRLEGVSGDAGRLQCRHLKANGGSIESDSTEEVIDGVPRMGCLDLLGIFVLWGATSVVIVALRYVGYPLASMLKGMLSSRSNNKSAVAIQSSIQSTPSHDIGHADLSKDLTKAVRGGVLEAGTRRITWSSCPLST